MQFEELQQSGGLNNLDGLYSKNIGKNKKTPRFLVKDDKKEKRKTNHHFLLRAK